MPGAGSEHPTAAKICRVGEGTSQEGVQGVFRVGDGAPFSPMGHPGVPRAKGRHCSLQAGPGRPQAPLWDGSLGLPVLHR